MRGVSRAPQVSPSSNLFAELSGNRRNAGAVDGSVQAGADPTADAHALTAGILGRLGKKRPRGRRCGVEAEVEVEVEDRPARIERGGRGAVWEKT